MFGLMISNGAEGLVASSVPFVLDAAASKLGTLKVHLARANSQWRDLEASPDTLVVFQGHDHYITPSWYETKRETGKVVPDLELYDGSGEGSRASDGATRGLPSRS